MMTHFEMWAGRADVSGRSATAEPDRVHASTYLQGPGNMPDEEKRRCVMLIFEEQIGRIVNTTRAEIRMEVGTARALHDKLARLLDRLERGALEPDDDYDYGWWDNEA